MAPEPIEKLVVDALFENVFAPAPRNVVEAKSVVRVLKVPEIVWAVEELKYTVPFESVNKPLFV